MTHGATSPKLTKRLSAAEARDFLIQRLSEQALLARTPFSDIEKRVLMFSKSNPQPDFAALDAFNEDHNTEEFETWIITLVRDAIDFNDQHDRGGMWKEAFRALKRADFYLIDIIERKGLS